MTASFSNRETLDSLSFINTETRQRIFNGFNNLRLLVISSLACVGVVTIAKELRVVVSSS